jgi:hypothetical protein
MTSCSIHFIDFPEKNSLKIGYIGAALSRGALPALIYFALSAEDSLLTSPYNHPPLTYLKKPLSLHGSSPDLEEDTMNQRVFSISLPFHQYGQNEQYTLDLWLEKLALSDPFLEDFLNNISTAVISLAPWISQWSFAGLSRGGWIAAHLCHRLNSFFQSLNQLVPLVLYAPITQLKGSLALKKKQDELEQTWQDLYKLNLNAYCLWTSIGHQDLRVDTQSAVLFFQSQIRATSPFSHHHKLTMYRSIGYLGHGTPDWVFNEGISWLTNIQQAF